MAAPTPPTDPEAIVTLFYPVGSLTRDLLLRHGERVAGKAMAVLDRAPWLDADRAFVYQAAILHDVGIGATRSPQLGCSGSLPYVCHGVEGRRMLDALGLTRHGRVCERHVGVGLRAVEIAARRLPLPLRDMLPQSLEERLICYADKFFSKSDDGCHEKCIETITRGLSRFGAAQVERFRVLHRLLTAAPPDGRDSTVEPNCHGKGSP